MLCPSCGKKLSATPEKVGHMAQCPRCGDSVRVMGEAGATEESAAVEASHGAGGPASKAARRAARPSEASALAAAASLWRTLFLTLCPLTLALGAFVGYVLRPLTPEQLVARARSEADDILAEARKERDRVLQGARSEADSILRAGRAQARDGGGSARPHETVGVAAGPGSRRVGVSYLTKVEILDFEVGESGLHRKALSGELRNVGDRVIEELQLTVACLDAGAQAVLTKTIYPVNAAPGAIGATPPLAPGGMTRFDVGLDDAPPEWSGKVEVRVSGVKLRK